jgi:hypothetical protein
VETMEAAKGGAGAQGMAVAERGWARAAGLGADTQAMAAAERAAGGVARARAGMAGGLVGTA